MKGIALQAHGGPECLVWQDDLPDPAPGPGEAVVRVAACALNFLDVWVRTGRQGGMPLPHVLGVDVCGTVESLGADAGALKAGDRVIVFPGLPATDGGAPGILGKSRWGGYAERVAVPAANCLPWPAGLAAPLAAALPLAFTTAHHMLHARGRLVAGETVLVRGASGGVGTAAVQLAKAAGARVLAVVGDADKAFRVKGRQT